MKPGRLDSARVFEQIFSIYRRQAAVLLPAAAVISAIPALLNLSRSTTAQALALAATVIASVLYQGVVVRAVSDIQDGVRDLSIGALFRSVSRVFGPLLWTVLLVVIGVFLGVLAFIVPGLILLTRWAVAAPVVVIEDRTPFDALARSGLLVRGHGWQVFSVLIVTLMIVVIVEGLLGAGAEAVSGSNVAYAIANLIAGVITAPIFALSSAVLYLELLKLKGEALPPAGPRTDGAI
jgi:hypothetical protein